MYITNQIIYLLCLLFVALIPVSSYIIERQTNFKKTLHRFGIGRIAYWTASYLFEVIRLFFMFGMLILSTSIVALMAKNSFSDMITSLTLIGYLKMTSAVLVYPLFLFATSIMFRKVQSGQHLLYGI